MKTIVAIILLSSSCLGQSTVTRVIYFMQENQSFEKYFCWLPGAVCTLTWTDSSNVTHTPTHLDPTVKYGDCPHMYDDITTSLGNNGTVLNQWDQGLACNLSGSTGGGITANADGIKTGYFDNGDIPQYARLALNFGEADNFFTMRVPSAPGHKGMLGDPEEMANNARGGDADGDGSYAAWGCDKTDRLGICSGGSNANAVCTVNGDCTGGGTCVFPSSHPFIYDMTATNYYSGQSNGHDALFNIAQNSSPSGLAATTAYISGRCGTSAVNVGASCVCAKNAATPCTDTPHCGNSSTCNATVGIGGQPGALCSETNSNLFSLMDTAGVTWGGYGPSINTPGYQWSAWSYYAAIRYGADWGTKVHPLSQLDTDIQNCTLPTISIVTPTNAVSEHSPADVRTGENTVAGHINTLMHSKCWPGTVVFISYDDFGGYWSNVIPPVPSSPTSTLYYGPRGPFTCVGQACKHAVDHTVYSFSSIIRYFENKFLLCPSHSPANDGCFGNLDATANSVAGMIDETQTPIPLPTQSARTGSFSGSVH